MKFRLAGALLLVAAFSSDAMTLGRVRGAAIIGRALDIAVQVQLDPGETLSNNCFEADVFHGDNRQDGSRVRIIVEPTATPQNVNVRVVSTAAVDEPVVTIYLRAVCGQQLGRRYVMLADVVTEQPSSAATSVPLPATVVPSIPLPSAVVDAGSTSAAIASGNAAGGSASAGSTTPAAVAADPAPKAVPVAKPKRPVAVRAAPPKPPVVPIKPATAPPASNDVAEKLQAGRTAGQSRLKLDPLEVLAGRVATLESSTASVPAEAAAREARDTQRVASMEANIKSLLSLAAKNEANLQDMRTRLEQAESERYANPVIYGLVVLLLLLLAAFVLLLRRGGQSGASGGNWWNNTGNGMPAAVPTQAGSARPRSSGFSVMSAPAPLSSPSALSGGDMEATQRTGPRSAPAPITQVDVSLVEMSESTFDRLMQSGVSHSAIRKPRAGETENTTALPPQAQPQHRSINSEELFDIRQQAEFFVSLGQTDQAVRILENRISQNGESSPLAYLDLLKIFHSLGLKADFRQVREDFNLLFNANVPEFVAFNEEGRDLEMYPEVLDKIVDEWGSPSVFAAIESQLFRGQWNSSTEAFDLAAFRDLLLLHAVMQWSLSASDSLPAPLVPTIPPPSIPARLGAATATSAFTGLATSARLDQTAVQPDAPLPSIDGLADLDIDLSDLYATSPATADDGANAGGAATIAVSPPSEEADNLIDFDLSGLDLQIPAKPDKT